MENYFIRDGSIGLRSIREDDRKEFFGWHDDSSIREKIGGVFPFSENTFKRICQSYNELNPSDIWFALCDEEMLIGIAGLHNIKYIQGNAELAILIGEKKERNKGKGSQILKLIEKYAFGTLNLHRLYAYVYGDNVEALLFFKRCLWKHEGTMKDASFWNYRFRDIEIWAKVNIEGMGTGATGRER